MGGSAGEIDLEAERAEVLGCTLGILTPKAVMLAAAFSATPPHTPGFLAPLIGAGAAIGIALATLLAAGQTRVLWLAPLFAVLALVSSGPHKLWPGSHLLFFAQSPAVYLAILAGTGFVVLLVRAVWRLMSLARGPRPSEP